MKNLINYFNKYKYPLVLLLIYIVYTIITWGKWGDIVFDSFREVLLPQALLDGKVMYRDITCLYPPLAYYWHAFLYSVFGQSLVVLYTVAIITSLTIFSFLYYIIKTKISEQTAFVMIYAIMSTLAFRVVFWHNCGSWYFPYSFSLLYALMFMIGAVVFLILYTDNKKIKNLYLCFLLAGISCAFKFDFVLFIIFPIICVFKTKSVKNILLSFLLLLFPLIAEICLFLCTGGSISDLLNEFELLKKYSNGHYIHVYYSYYIPLFLNNIVLSDIRYSFYFFLKIFGSFLIICSLFQSIIFSVKKTKIKILLYIIEFIILFTALIPLSKFHKETMFHFNLTFLPLFIFISFLCILITTKFKISPPIKNVKVFLFIILIAITFTIRTPFAPYISNVGNYNIIFYIIALVYLFLEIIPNYNIKFINPKCLKSIFAISLLFYFSTYMANYLNYSKMLNFDVSKKYDSQKGTMYIDLFENRMFVEIADYFIKNTPKDSSVLIVPEYLIINYYTGRKVANYKYYNLIPHIIEMYGEQNIIEELKKNPPDYFVWTKISYPYKPDEVWHIFGIDYGADIQKYFTDNYDVVEKIYDQSMEDVIASIYKRRD